LFGGFSSFILIYAVIIDFAGRYGACREAGLCANLEKHDGTFATSKLIGDAKDGKNSFEIGFDWVCFRKSRGVGLFS